MYLASRETGQVPSFTILGLVRRTYAPKSWGRVLSMSDNPSGLNDLRWFGHNCKIGGLSPQTASIVILAPVCNTAPPLSFPHPVIPVKTGIRSGTGLAGIQEYAR